MAHPIAPAVAVPPPAAFAINNINNDVIPSANTNADANLGANLNEHAAIEAADVVESIMVDVTKANFIEQSNDFIQRLPNASWIALDEEMTGIMIPSQKRPAKDETPAARYASSLKQVPERYSIIQLGICLFEQAKPTKASSSPQFHVRRYKFTLFPGEDSQREIVMNPSSMQFLRANNLDLDLWVRDGLPFCTGDVAGELLEKFHGKQLKITAKAAAPAPPAPSLAATSPFRRKRVELTRMEDKDFHARGMASLREWLDAPVVPGEDDPEGASFLLPPCNSFLRRALYESIPNEYPNLVLETFQESQIRVWRLNAAEKILRNKRLLKEGWEKLLTEKIGVWRIFLALTKACRGEGALTQAEHMILAPNAPESMAPMPSLPTLTPPSDNNGENGSSLTTPSRRKIPVIVHNGLQDLMFLMTHFHSPILPEAWADTKDLIHKYFPIVYDTKCMASEYCTRNATPRGRTHLSAVYEQSLVQSPQWESRVFVSASNNNNPDGAGGREQQQQQLQDQCHDAAYDAYMTGAAFCGLVLAIQDQTTAASGSNSKVAVWDTLPDDESTSWFYGRNKLHFHLSPYTIDLESPDSDPLGRGMSARSTFRIASIDPSVTTRDIVRCLTGLTDSLSQRVNFEIVWVDDTTFLVGAMLQDCRDPDRYQEHGDILLQALTQRFQKEIIHPLEALLAETDAPTEAGSWKNLWGLLKLGGSTNKRRQRTLDKDQSNKRRRLN